MNKLLNQYTIMLRGFAIPSDGDISDIVNSRKLGKALSRNNKWLNVSSFFLRGLLTRY